MTNKDIKTEAFAKGVKLWQIADKLNISEPTLFRWLRKELPSETKARIFAIITDLANENK